MRRALLSACLLGIMVLWFAALALRPLFNPDEGRYAEIPREMLATGDWVIPHLNGLAYIEKPPLQYWATAAAFRVFGESPWAARLYATLCAFASLCVVGWTARTLWGSAAAGQAVLLTGSMLLFLGLAHVLTLDMSLSFWMTAGLCAFLLTQHHARQGHASKARQAMLAAWTCVALGVLTKGLVAAVIPAAVLILYTVLGRDASPWRHLQWLPGLGLFLLIVLPWHVLAQRRLPDFFQFYIVREHFARFATPVADRQEPWWFFVVVFLLGTMPWSIAGVRALATGWRDRSEPGFDARTFLKIWVLFILLFFSLSDSKLIPYILPAVPALGLLLGAQPPQAGRQDTAHASWLLVLAGALLGIGAAALPWLLGPDSRAPYFLALRPAAGVASGLLLASGLLGLARRGSMSGVPAALPAAGWVAAVLVLLLGASVLGPVYSGSTLVHGLPAPDRAAPVFSVRTYDQTLPFYWRRTLTLVEYQGEMDYGLRHDPGLAIGSLEEFKVRWRQLDRGFAVMEPETLNTLRAQDLPMRIVASDERRVLVARR